MNLGHLITLEGPCAAGKSTVMKSVIELMEERVQCLPENIAFLKNPPAPPKSTLEAINNDRFFLDVDESRSKRARELQLARKHVLSERCVLGTLSIAYGYDHTFHSFDETAKTCLHLLSQGYFRPPTAYLFFNISNATIHDRLEGKFGRVDRVGAGWTSQEALDLQREFLYFSLSCLSSIPIFYINAESPINEMRDSVIDIIESILAQPAEVTKEQDKLFREDLKSCISSKL